ncbi:MAG: hypothetical protein EU518_01105, partial [Promethearchaeota archaeon]
MVNHNKKLYLILLALSLGLFIGMPNETEANGGPPYNIIIPPNDYFNLTYSYNFLQFDFNISTNVYTILNLDFNLSYHLLTSRQISLEIKNNEDVELEFTAIFDIEGFLDNLPENPSFQDLILGFQYNSFYKIKSNTSISQLSFKFIKSPIFGFQTEDNFSIGYYKGEISGNPELLSTYESESEGVNYINGEIESLEEEEVYYFTIYEVNEKPENPPSYNWLWILIPIAIGFVGILIVLSKKDYIKHIKRRTTS